MPTSTYTSLATVTLASSASSVTFSSIPATYRDLILVAEAKNATGSYDISYRFNGDTGANYSRVFMSGNGSAASSGSDTANFFGYSISTAFMPVITQIMDYSATDKHKTVLSRLSGASFVVAAYTGRWASTSAVNTIRLAPDAGTSFTAGSTFSLYGVIA